MRLVTWSAVVVLAMGSGGSMCGGDHHDPTGDGNGGSGSNGSGGGSGMTDGGTDDSTDPEALCTDPAQCPGHVTIIHAWGITNPAPLLWTSGYAQTTNNHCSWAPHESCQEVVESGPASEGPVGRCCATTATGPDCMNSFAGMWQSWIRDWWLEGWLPSLGLSKADVRKFYVIYNRNGFWGGPHHDEDCEAILQMEQALVNAYRQCDSHVIVTTHSNGGVTFLWGYRTFVEDALYGPNAASIDQDRITTCTAKGRMMQNGAAPPLFVNAHLMQAAVGDGSNTGESPNDFFPLQPYDATAKRYWEPRDGAGNLRVLPGIRFYYNHEDVMTYDFDGVSTVGRNEVLRWMAGDTNDSTQGATFWNGHTGSPPFIALHACGHQSSYSASMGVDNSICGDLIVRDPGGSVLGEAACSRYCATMQDWYDSAQGPGQCLNPCHKNCWAPTALTSIQINGPAVYPDKYPFSYGNQNIANMTPDGFTRGGWKENAMKLDWADLYDKQRGWCQQDRLDEEQEHYTMGRGPKFGPLISGRNDGNGEVKF
jgi:hypothetical protein